MKAAFQIALLASTLFTGSLGMTHAQTAPAPAITVQDIAKEIRDLRQIPEAQQGARTAEIALQIRTLPAGSDKLKIAVGLASRSTEGDPGTEALQAVTTTLTQAIRESPISMRNGRPARPYLLLAQLVRYEGMTTI